MSTNDKCPVCKSPLTFTPLGEVCSNDDCGYVDGMDFGPPKRNIINDVEWRTLDDKSEQLLRKNPDNKVLIQTNITYHIDDAENIVKGRLIMDGKHNENVIRFAFFK